MKKNNNDFFDGFKYNYEHLEGFDSLVKIVLFFAISIVILVVARISINTESKEEKTTTTSIVQKQEKILSVIESIIKKEATIKVTSDTTKIQISSLRENGEEITGFYQDINTSKKFKIKENKVYELILDDEIENEELLSLVNMDFVIPSVLFSVIQESTFENEKNEIETIYTYTYLKDDITYNIEVTVAAKNVQSIVISSDTTKYEITYK